MESLEQIEARHRKEQRDLVATITSLKKTATKGEKKKKKEVLARCEEMERELKARHLAELADARGTSEADSGGASDEVDLLAQLALDIQLDKQDEQDQGKEDIQEHEYAQGKGKRNRQKERAARKKAAMEQESAQARLEAALQPDLRQIELDNMAALCAKLGKAQHDILPDGHCLFAAIADQLDQRVGLTRSAAALRKQAAEHMRANADSFSPFLYDDRRDLAAYCDEIENTAMWGGDMEILALAQAYGVTVTVVITGQGRVSMNEGCSTELWLAYYKHSYGLGAHYNSLRDK